MITGCWFINGVMFVIAIDRFITLWLDWFSGLLVRLFSDIAFDGCWCDDDGVLGFVLDCGWF